MSSDEVEKSAMHVVTEVVEYQPNSAVNKIIIKKPTGSIIVSSFDAGTKYAEQVSPFDTYILIIEGRVEIQIDGKLNFIQSGEGIVIPAQHRINLIVNERFKMIVTVIKSGY